LKQQGENIKNGKKDKHIPPKKLTYFIRGTVV
jgi:hypothetical protein